MEFHERQEDIKGRIEAGVPDVPDKLILRLVHGKLTTIERNKITLRDKFVAFFRGDFSLKKISDYLNTPDFQNTIPEAQSVKTEAALKTLNEKIEKRNIEERKKKFFSSEVPLIKTIHERVNAAATTVISKKHPPSPPSDVPSPQKKPIPTGKVTPHSEVPPKPASSKVTPTGTPNIPSPPSYVPPSPTPPATAKASPPPSNKPGLIDLVGKIYKKEYTAKRPEFYKKNPENYPSEFYTEIKNNGVHRRHLNFSPHSQTADWYEGQEDRDIKGFHSDSLNRLDQAIAAETKKIEACTATINKCDAILSKVSRSTIPILTQEIEELEEKLQHLQNNQEILKVTETKKQKEAVRAKIQQTYNEKNAAYAEKTTASGTRKNFQDDKDHKFFNIHNIAFQNYALAVCSNPERWAQIKEANAKDSLPLPPPPPGTPKPKDVPPATLSQLIFRARNYAISSRDDIDWNGKKFTDEAAKNAKKKLLDDNASSLVLYDWGGVDDTKLDTTTPGHEKTKYTVVDSTTQKAVARLQAEYPKNEKIAWLNMANAHRVGGGYQTHKGTQEENTIVACDAAAILGTQGTLKEHDQRVHYKPKCHIPPGGNYFHKTRFFTEDPPIDCYSIVHAVADFRNNNSPESEYNDYPKRTTKDPQGKDRITIDSTTKKYQERIELDMRSILRTAKIEGMEILVLGATGCGAFQHNPEAEAKAWAKVLQETEFQGHFKEVQFAVLGEDTAQTFTTPPLRRKT